MAIQQLQPDPSQTSTTQPVKKPAPPTTNPTLPVAGGPVAATPAPTPKPPTPSAGGALPVAGQTLGAIQPAQTSDPLAFTPVNSTTGDAAPFTPGGAASTLNAAAPIVPQQNGAADAYDAKWKAYNDNNALLSQFTNAPAANVPGGSDINVKLTEALKSGQITPDQFQALSRQNLANTGVLAADDSQPGVAAPWAMGQTDRANGEADPVQEVTKLYVSGAITPEQYQAYMQNPTTNPIQGIGTLPDSATYGSPNGGGYGYKSQAMDPYAAGSVGTNGQVIPATLQPYSSSTGTVATSGFNPGGPNTNLAPTDRAISPGTIPTQTLPGVGTSQGPTNGLPSLPPNTTPMGTLGGTTTGAPSTAPTLTPLTPDNALTNSIISPASNVDRFDLAKNQLEDTIKNTLEPQFNADARTIAAQSFGAGRGVSGMNRTREGDLEQAHERDIDQLTSNFLNPALSGTIQDALNNANFAAGQQQFEAGQQGQAFNQATTLQELADAENSQQFNQALQKLLVGSQGDPTQILSLLAQIYGGEGAQSAQAANNLAKSTVS